MQTLQLRDAKASLSAVVASAQRGQPTIITRHGRPAKSRLFRNSLNCSWLQICQRLENIWNCTGHVLKAIAPGQNN